MTITSTADTRKLTWAEAYRLRWKRRHLLWKSFRSRHRLRSVADRTSEIKPGDILIVMTVRNEMNRLPYFLHYYRDLGIGHFLVIDNDSTDGTDTMLAKQSDVSLWQTSDSYRASRFGLNWMTWLQRRYAHGHWTLMVDADELLVYAHHDTRPLPDLTAWLDSQGSTAFGALMLDLYPKGPLNAVSYTPGTDPTQAIDWFDAGPYRSQRQLPLGNLWTQGGMRERVFFADEPRRSPTLNKIPLVKWHRSYAYVNSCHSILPPTLNRAYDGPGDNRASGVLLHTKFLPEIVSKSAIEKERAQHFHTPQDFDNYYDSITAAPQIWTETSTHYRNWRHLEELGLMNSGGW
ncbi:glycosyltransferase family 2 protein [Falsiruegeria mediterranea]|uniref:Glycosyltransferase 2-like domain-containing protein n=1 Tax=Falsiruegeria mediterranea M17 TaxID=1200281 RepID=A0A2R8C3S6_9RHOB|nr:glycosyltransferase family 2 protein [Falsiruegeria mediterranea]SPJ27052.1 hypothetical protein TRM7615_00531 [Falsiruegeria mediterranea M17]